ncbi:hypothetical protein COCC4DRAFT_143882 [Bipolaris maydis ATCC 48331]|uniref:Uncharacterized protein n=2 Tax=Cochliobolus heterostrophus TaxID=5016 RepID=M2SN23_COCH5|nr:uncharacterized protein COCC4DRAFT_143882 [Bipolaris maydis ATCC 48331]EMD86735.1 hypothetical protein COCHEDRAFT_1034502 [Bipolaris maydis C5]ENI03126.1 hypothetical protein COCC4DRAFT_143882 [Bipolaris maydis ATCC 48331]KAJ5052540.1 hypothetical protein J3E74DRAFT_295633 [Bipolaris maydis]KAJ6267353.1 hypothetical protein PSV08DRAFT_250527 [Bipolaris maydis]
MYSSAEIPQSGSSKASRRLPRHTPPQVSSIVLHSELSNKSKKREYVSDTEIGSDPIETSEDEAIEQASKRLKTGVQQRSAKSGLKRKASDEFITVPAKEWESMKEMNSKLAGRVFQLKTKLEEGSGETHRGIGVEKIFQKLQFLHDDIGKNIALLKRAIPSPPVSPQPPSIEA